MQRHLWREIPNYNTTTTTPQQHHMPTEKNLINFQSYLIKPYHFAI